VNSIAPNKQGFTLMESLVAISVFTMVIAGGLIGVRKGFEVVDNSRHYTRLSQVLQSEVESLRTLSWEDLSELPAAETLTLETEFETKAYEAYTVTREIINEQADRKRVEVSVRYTNKNGKPVSLKYLTFFTEGGVNDYFYRTIR